MLLHFASLALAATVGAAPAAATPAVSAVVADSDVVLTVDALTQMTKFWAAFMKETPAVRDTGRAKHQKPLTVDAGSQQLQLPGVVDMAAMAAAYPSVAADLKAAGLTAAQWEQYRKALVGASVAIQLAKANNTTPAATTAVGKNVVFLTAHTKEFDALKATGMWFPQVQMGNGMGGGGDLDP